MILSKEDSLYASKLVVDYFSKFERIDDYFRARKIERVKQLPGMSKKYWTKKNCSKTKN